MSIFNTDEFLQSMKIDVYVLKKEKKKKKQIYVGNKFVYFSSKHYIFSDIYIYIFRLGKKLEWKKIILKLEATIILYTERKK